MRCEAMIWLKVRRRLLRAMGAKVGANVNIFADVFIEGAEGLTIGDNVSINRGGYLSAAGGLDIGDDCAIGAFVIILTSEHGKDGPVREQPIIYKRTTLGRSCWLGARVSIRAGIDLAEGTTVGLGSVATRSTVEPGATIVGNPARTIRHQ